MPSSLLIVSSRCQALLSNVVSTGAFLTTFAIYPTASHLLPSDEAVLVSPLWLPSSGHLAAQLPFAKVSHSGFPLPKYRIQALQKTFEAAR